jgi:hypothetical protein
MVVRDFKEADVSAESVEVRDDGPCRCSLYPAVL